MSEQASRSLGQDRVIDLDAIIAEMESGGPIDPTDPASALRMSVSDLIDSVSDQLSLITAPLRKPLSVAQEQISADADAIEAIALAPDKPGAIFRPVRDQKLIVQVFDMDWESVGAMLDKQGTVPTDTGLGFARYQIEIPGVTVGKKPPRPAFAEIILRKAGQRHTLIEVQYKAAPSNRIDYFVACSRVLLRFVKLIQLYWGQHIEVAVASSRSTSPLSAAAEAEYQRMRPRWREFSDLLRQGMRPVEIARFANIVNGSVNQEISRARKKHGEELFPKQEVLRAKNLNDPQ